MNASLTATVPHTNGSCGCANSTTAVAAGCTCGGAGCGICQSQTFVRPRFFAGQLLTEDDLQLLGDYVVAKNRLHNRFLFGEGVVCGLQVICHPCGDGLVIVHPGYALDCCGNDITLSCPQTLDINAMVRELRRKSLGYDCGDPCADKKPSQADCKDGKTSDETAKPGAASEGKPKEKQEEGARHYCLYIRYCEEQTDPVAPYSTGEPCGAQGCEPTRVREGVQFELRCREEEKRPDNLFTRICQCLGDLKSVEKSAKDSLYFQGVASQLRSAANAIKADPVPPFKDTDAQALESVTQSLFKTLNKIDPGVPEVSEALLRAALDATLETASIVARFYSRTEDKQKVLEGEIQRVLVSSALQLTAKLGQAREALAKAQETITQQRIEQILTIPLEKESALSLMELSKRLLEPSGLVKDLEIRFLAERTVFTSRIMPTFMISLDALREWLLDRLDKSPHLADCELRQIIRKTIVAVPSSEEYKGTGMPVLSGAMVVSTAAEKLRNVFTRYLRDCVCAAFNPACQPCDDPAVLLACLEVKDCEVVRICNLERTFVLSPTSIRYWAPIDLLGKFIEQACCPVAECPDSEQASGIKEKTVELFTKSAWSADYSKSLPVSLREFSVFLSAVLSQICNKEQQQLNKALVPIVNLFQRTSDFTARGVMYDTRKAFIDNWRA